MEFLEIGKAIAELTTTTVIIAAVIYLLIKYFSSIIDNKIKKDNNEKNIKHEEQVEHLGLGSIQILKEMHPYFSKIDSLITVKLPFTKIGGPVRTLIFRDVLKIFYETSRDINYKLLDEHITLDNFLSKNREALNEIIKNSTERMHDYGIPEVVVEKFWEWNYKRHEYVMNTLSDIDSSTIFSSVIEKQYAALNLYQSTSYFVLMDAENTLKNLNGDLTGRIYKGKIVESLHEEE